MAAELTAAEHAAAVLQGATYLDGGWSGDAGPMGARGLERRARWRRMRFSPQLRKDPFLAQLQIPVEAGSG